MKTLVTLLVFCVFAAAQGTLFLLPHRRHDARHRLLVDIRTAQRHITVVTARLDDRHLEKALREMLKQGRRIELLTASTETASKWALYRNVSACILPHPPRFSMVIANTICLVGDALVTEAWHNGYSFVQCGANIDVARSLLWMRRDCRAYLSGESR